MKICWTMIKGPEIENIVRNGLSVSIREMDQANKKGQRQEVEGRLMVTYQLAEEAKC